MARRPRIDRELARYLVGGETVIVAVRKHWFHLARQIAALLLATVLAIWADTSTGTSPGGGLIRNVTLVGFWASLLWLLWTVLNWRHDWFVATDKRFLLFYGFIRRRVAMMPLHKVTDMTYDRSILGRVVGFGTFVLESAGQDQALSTVDHVPDADEHYRAICTQLFGPGAMLRPPGGGGGGPFGPGGGPGRGGPGPGPGGPGGPSAPDDAPEDPWPTTDPEPVRYPDGSLDATSVGDGGVRVSPRGHPRGPKDQPESWYRSSNLDGSSHLGDTGEIPVVRPRRTSARRPSREAPLYPPREWMD